MKKRPRSNSLAPTTTDLPRSIVFWRALIGYWSHMLAGQSYWHGSHGLGKSFRPGELQDYYRDYSTKVHWNGAEDELQLPLVQEPGGKRFYHPLILAQKALGHWSRWLIGREQHEKDCESFLQIARWLVKMQESQGSWDIPSMHNPVFIVPYSALVQGQAASVLVRAFSITSEEMYLNAARRGIQFMLTPMEHGGLCRNTTEGPILEEYPQHQKSTVFNGWVSALYGLYDLLLVEDQSETRSAMDASLDALIAHLPLYDAGFWSRYDTSGTIASSYYHRVHITQLRALELTFSQHSNACRTLRTRFERQLSSSVCCTKAFIFKVIQKLKQPPPLLVIPSKPTS